MNIQHSTFNIQRPGGGAMRRALVLPPALVTIIVTLALRAQARPQPPLPVMHAVTVNSNGALVGSDTNFFNNNTNLWLGLIPSGVNGDGSGLTNLNASALESGTLPDARLSGNVLMNNWAGGDVAIDSDNAGTNTFGGNLTILGYSVQAGTSTASGNMSHAEGGTAVASGQYSHSEGVASLSAGSGSHAEGGITKATGDYSHAEGNNTLASAGYSHAEGGSTTASGSGSHAEGVNTIASGSGSHAEGSGTLASGYYSHAGGANAKATNNEAYVWSDGTPFGSVADNSYSAYAANGFRFLGGPITGNGSGLASLNAAQLASGTVPDARLAANVVRTNNAGAVTLTNAANVFAGSLTVSNGCLTVIGTNARPNNINSAAAWMCISNNGQIFKIPLYQ